MTSIVGLLEMDLEVCKNITELKVSMIVREGDKEGLQTIQKQERERLE